MSGRPLLDPLSLYQAPSYQVGKTWYSSFPAARTATGPLTWDSAAILSLLCFNFASGDRTLLCEVKRQPWLSELGGDAEPMLAQIPSHGLKWLEPQVIARRLSDLLSEEAERACQGRKQIYVLLSGGLDSRIVAGILATLYRRGRLSTKPITLTWGLEDCRDVVYAKCVAKILDLEWEHIPMGPSSLWTNIELAADTLGGLVPPIHLHAMPWLRHLEQDAIVLAGSYGDSIGRAEFSGRHLLELKPLTPTNPTRLIHPSVARAATEHIKEDLRELHARSATSPRHVVCEHEMQAFYMRGLIAHAMSLVNDYCSLYQMFTAYPVYSFMWLLHPACRDDRPYTLLLEQLDPRLLTLPWARTNKALYGPTVGRHRGLRVPFHEYVTWIKGPLANDLGDCVDPMWFSTISIFDKTRISELRDRTLRPRGHLNLDGRRPYEILVWLACFRRFAEMLRSTTNCCEADPVKPSTANVSNLAAQSLSAIRRFIRGSRLLYAANKRVRLGVLKRRAITQFPPAVSDD